jgi:hypothetical protein
MEFIEIDGDRVQIPQDVVSEGRAAVTAWAEAEAARRRGGAAQTTTTEG